MGLRGTIRALIVDHYDSYTNNILQLLQGTGETPEGVSYPEWSVAVVRFDQYSWQYFKDEIIPELDAIILSPGPGRPDKKSDFGFNSKLIKEANIPILGICLGHQGIGMTFGAKIIHATNIKHGQISKVSHSNTGILRGLPQQFDAVRYNSLVLDAESLPPELQVTAWTYDVEDATRKVLMGIQHCQRPIFGIQWHPESICSAYGNAITSNFREVVLDFWHVNSPWNLWSRRSVRTNASLSQKLMDESAIVNEAIQASPPAPQIPALAESLPYYVKAVDLGKGIHPRHLFEKFVRGSTSDGEAWLDSAKVNDVYSRNSYLAAAAFAISYSTRTRKLSFYRDNKLLGTEKLQDSYWSWLDKFQKNDIQNNIHAIPANLLGQETEAGQSILQVGLIGYFGYELKRESLPGYVFIPSSSEDEGSQRDAHLIFADRVLWLDNYTQSWKAFGLLRRGSADPIATAVGSKSPVGMTEAEFTNYVKSIQLSFAQSSFSCQVKPVPLAEFTPIDNEETYTVSVQAARAAIREGESYELTLTTKFRALSSANTDPYALYLSLRSRNPAPYSAYLNFPIFDLAILSSSPERFISIDRSGVVEMKPIKGTVAVSPDKEENMRRINHLQTDTKELAENLMIVDLIRADLHNVCPSPSIHVPKLLKVESYETVHQLVTTIQSHVAPRIGPVKVLERIFPPGSMTGAPKLRSVQMLDALERHANRGIYSGCLGYLCVSGCIDQSVVIRTIVKQGIELELCAGGAITWLSKPDKEWEEVILKANAVATLRISPHGRLE